MQRYVESLEFRVLFSDTTPATLAADKSQISQDQAAITATYKSLLASEKADDSAISAHLKGVDVRTNKPLLAKLKSDQTRSNAAINKAIKSLTHSASGATNKSVSAGTSLIKKFSAKTQAKVSQDAALLQGVCTSPLAALQSALSGQTVQNDLQALTSANSSDTALASLASTRIQDAQNAQTNIQNNGQQLQSGVLTLADDLGNISSTNAIPTSLNGNTLVLLKSSLGDGITSPAIARIAFSKASAAVEAFLQADQSGTTHYSYRATGSATATLTLGSSSVAMTFTTPSSGSAHVTAPDGSYDAVFTVATTSLQNVAPSSIASANIGLNISGGVGSRYASSGAASLALNSDSTFNWTTNGLPAVSGTYTYEQTVGAQPGIAMLALSTTNGDVPDYLYLVFDSSGSQGIFYLTNTTSSNISSNLTDLEYGNFSLELSSI